MTSYEKLKAENEKIKIENEKIKKIINQIIYATTYLENDINYRYDEKDIPTIKAFINAIKIFTKDL